MLRYLGEFLSLLFFFAMAKSIITAIVQVFRSSGSIPNPAYRPPETKSSEIPTSGELRKDPVCGTFVAMNSPYTQMRGNDTIYFCSKDCRDRFKTQKQWPKSSAVRS